MFGGGADTIALCGRVVAWDVAVDLTKHHLSHCCKKCLEQFMEMAKVPLADG